MFLNSLNVKVTKPIYVNVKADGLTSSIVKIEEQTGLVLNIRDLLQEILSCLTDYNTAQLELEMYGLSLMEEHSAAWHENDTRKIIDLFVNVGLNIFEQLTHYGFYSQDKLQFAYSHHLMDNVVFMDKKSMLKLLHEEFNQPSIRHWKPDPSPWRKLVL